MTYKRAPYSQTSPDTLDVVIEQEQHESLTPDRHAELVAYLIRHVPNAWRVLFRPSIYLYDHDDKIYAASLEQSAANMRVRFMFETDWDYANEIIRELLKIDAKLYAMSIGCTIDGRNYYGEPL